MQVCVSQTMTLSGMCAWAGHLRVERLFCSTRTNLQLNRRSLASHAEHSLLAGVRIPDNNFIRGVCRGLGRPLALTSANLSGAPSPLAASAWQ